MTDEQAHRQRVALVRNRFVFQRVARTHASLRPGFDSMDANYCLDAPSGLPCAVTRDASGYLWVDPINRDDL